VLQNDIQQQDVVVRPAGLRGISATPFGLMEAISSPANSKKLIVKIEKGMGFIISCFSTKYI